jgi:hypothetical protein
LTDVALPDGLADRLRIELGLELAEAEAIDPGVIHNNRLVRLTGADGRRLVLKSYYRDDRGRLEREFAAFAFLRDRGVSGVPAALLRDDAGYCAVYSFEPGVTKSAADLTLDELSAIGRLAAEIHRFAPDESGAEAGLFRPAGGGPVFPLAFAARSLAERAGFLRRRVATCLQAAAAPDGYEPLRTVVGELDLAATFERLIGDLTAGLTDAEATAPTPDSFLRFNSGDFAPHNLLVRPDGSICAIDFEFFGWEEAAALPVSFLAAEQSADLSHAQADAFLQAYRAGVDLPDAAFACFDRLRAYFEVSWAVVNLSLMTPAHVARKRFAGDFDLDAHLAERRTKLARRLSSAAMLVAAQA